jgi:hypothetical protein
MSIARVSQPFGCMSFECDERRLAGGVETALGRYRRSRSHCASDGWDLPHTPERNSAPAGQRGCAKVRTAPEEGGGEEAARYGRKHAAATLPPDVSTAAQRYS